jgi:FKBP12-rapamycin complex-associated protein
MTSKDVRCVFLDLVAFFDKERYVLDRSICDAAKTCALGKFTGGVNEALPAIALYVLVAWKIDQQ